MVGWVEAASLRSSSAQHRAFPWRVTPRIRGRALDRDRDGYVSVRVGLRGRRERARSRPPRQRARRERHPDVLVSEDDGIDRLRDPRFASVASRPSRRVRLRGRRRAG